LVVNAVVAIARGSLSAGLIELVAQGQFASEASVEFERGVHLAVKEIKAPVVVPREASANLDAAVGIRGNRSIHLIAAVGLSDRLVWSFRQWLESHGKQKKKHVSCDVGWILDWVGSGVQHLIAVSEGKRLCRFALQQGNKIVALIDAKA
jgi:hypothetical protein